MRKILLFVMAGVLLLCTAMYAHHSYAATYDVNKEIELEGRVVQFVFRNPHSFVHIQAPDHKGIQQRWSVEWAGTSQLTNSGIGRETLRVGDDITVTGNPSRVSGEYRLRLVRLKRLSDGFTWGTRPGETVD